MKLSVLLLSTITALTLAGPVPEAAANEKRQDHKTIFVTADTWVSSLIRPISFALRIFSLSNRNWNGLRAWVPVGWNVMYDWAQVIFENGDSGNVHGPGSLGPDPGMYLLRQRRKSRRLLVLWHAKTRTQVFVAFSTWMMGANQTLSAVLVPPIPVIGLIQSLSSVGGRLGSISLRKTIP